MLRYIQTITLLSNTHIHPMRYYILQVSFFALLGYILSFAGVYSICF